MAEEQPFRPKSVPPPQCKAILLCQRAIIEAGTGKISLIDLATNFTIEAPSIEPFVVFLQLIEGFPGHEYEITVEMHDLLEGSMMGGAIEKKLRWKKRLQHINLLIPMRLRSINHSGQYDLVINANGEEIGRQKFSVTLLPPSDLSEDNYE